MDAMELDERELAALARLRALRHETDEIERAARLQAARQREEYLFARPGLLAWLLAAIAIGFQFAQ